jgi:hypothetical protein
MPFTIQPYSAFLSIFSISYIRSCLPLEHFLPSFRSTQVASPRIIFPAFEHPRKTMYRHTSHLVSEISPSSLHFLRSYCSILTRGVPNQGVDVPIILPPFRCHLPKTVPPCILYLRNSSLHNLRGTSAVHFRFTIPFLQVHSCRRIFFAFVSTKQLVR